MRKTSHSLPEVSTENCRRFLRNALQFDSRLPSATAAVLYHGYVQIDPINVCGRMHDLILRNRVRDYHPDGLFTSMHVPEQRRLFEHYLPGKGILVALPVEDYRFLLPDLRRRSRSTGTWGAISGREKTLAVKILRRLRDEGPLGASAFADSERAIGIWGVTGTLAKHTLDKLCYHGRVLVSRREKFRRVYDLPERVLPKELLAAKPPTAREVLRWRLLKELQQRRLVRLPGGRQDVLKEIVQEVKVAGLPPLFCLCEDVDRLLLGQERVPRSPRLIAPLDPLIYDRKLTAALWEFPYTWEVYLPQSRRMRGYYALPVLAGTNVVGHVNPRAERETRTLHVGVSVTPDVDVYPALERLARFLGLKSVVVQEEPVPSGLGPSR